MKPIIMVTSILSAIPGASAGEGSLFRDGVN